ncbi:MAG: hypothetical protein ACF787_09215 [Rhodopirellula sp. JB053]
MLEATQNKGVIWMSHLKREAYLNLRVTVLSLFALSAIGCSGERFTVSSLVVKGNRTTMLLENVADSEGNLLLIVASSAGRGISVTNGQDGPIIKSRTGEVIRSVAPKVRLIVCSRNGQSEALVDRDDVPSSITLAWLMKETASEDHRMVPPGSLDGATQR